MKNPKPFKNWTFKFGSNDVWKIETEICWKKKKKLRKKKGDNQPKLKFYFLENQTRNQNSLCTIKNTLVIIYARKGQLKSISYI